MTAYWRLFALVLLLTDTAFAQRQSKKPEPQWQPALAYGGSPDCPDRAGRRVYRSDVVRDSHTTAFIMGTTVRRTTGCRSTAEIQVNQSGKVWTFAISGPGKEDFSIVDFSPDGSRLLLDHIYGEDELHQRRDVSVALMPIESGLIEWRNTWDLFGWKDCVAMVEPQGFLSDGRIVLRARKTVRVGDTVQNCVNDIGLYAVDLNTAGVARLPDSTKITRFGQRMRPGFQACKSDPDIVDACFKVHGRLSAWNGTPTMRIWRVGTNRILGVHDDIMPESLTSKLDWDVEAYGDYDVCPFTRERAGEMQMVCIEAAEHVFAKKRR